jgi:hypothetical protein
LFEPLIGNGKHWELGGGLSMHYTLWRSEDADSQFDFNLEADITHLFKAKQRRCLDLKCKPLSRFMLAAKHHGTPILDGLQADGTAPNRQFALEVSPVANLTSQEVDVSVSVQGDLAAYFTYQCKGFNWDIGYNFWGRSCEDVDRRDCNDSCNDDDIAALTWALKGDAQAFGFNQNNNTAVALSFSQSNATIFAGTNDVASNVADTNANIDNAKLATSNGILLNSSIGGAEQINTSGNPIFISNDDVDLSGTRGISHKIFTHFNYNWEREDYTPYIGFGASVEFGKTESSNCDNCCDATGSNTVNLACNTGCDTDCDSNCMDCAVSQWGVFLKVGVSFQ